MSLCVRFVSLVNIGSGNDLLSDGTKPLDGPMLTYYNMVGVAVAMVIPTMHEKSCIDSHNARKFE